MPVTDAAVKTLLGYLPESRKITSRKMFGGIGIYSDGVFFAVIDDDRLFFKSDDQTNPAYDAHHAAPWVIEGDPPSVMPYREVPAAVLSDPQTLGAWIDDAVGVAGRKAKKPKRGTA